jgi:hypothetical protein
MLQDQLVVDKFGGELLNLFQNIETCPVVLWYHYTISFGNDKNLFSHVYIFVPRTRIPKFKKKFLQERF